MDLWHAKDGYHYTVRELSDAWNVSDDFIRDLFQEEPDVIRWVRHRPGRRRYITVRIPAATADRVYRRAMTVEVRHVGRR